MLSHSTSAVGYTDLSVVSDLCSYSDRHCVFNLSLFFVWAMFVGIAHLNFHYLSVCVYFRESTSILWCVILPTFSCVLKVSIFQLRHSPFSYLSCFEVYLVFIGRAHFKLNAFVIQTKLNYRAAQISQVMGFRGEEGLFVNLKANVCKCICHKILEQFTLLKQSSSWKNCAGWPSPCKQKWYMDLPGSACAPKFTCISTAFGYHTILSDYQSKTVWAHSLWTFHWGLERSWQFDTT